MAGKKEQSPIVRMYLILYNFASFAGWAAVLYTLVKHLMAINYMDEIQNVDL